MIVFFPDVLFLFFVKIFGEKFEEKKSAHSTDRK